MPTPIATINETTWAEASASASAERAPLIVRQFALARPCGVVIAAELVLLCVAILQAELTGGTFEAPMLIGCMAMAVYLKSLDESIVRASDELYWRDYAGTVLWGAGTGLLLLRAFPAFGFRPEAITAALVSATVLPAILRPALQFMAVGKKLHERILIVGTGRLAEKLHHALASSGTVMEQTPAVSKLVRFPGAQQEASGVTEYDQLPEYLVREHISRVIVAEQNQQSRAQLASTLVMPRLSGVIVNDAADFYEQVFEKVWVDALSSEWFCYTGGFKTSRLRSMLKRCFDIMFAVVLLILTSPILLLTAIAIRLESEGPILFRQVRVGLDRNTFEIFKFRSMRTDAEKGGPVWASQGGDDRCTRIGAILRKLHIDEIPQVFNVLRGEMSLVGPRPERPYFVERLTKEIPFYNLRHCVKPGITGLAQFKYRYGASVEDAVEKHQYDLYYAKHGSCMTDVWILIKTFHLIVSGKA